MPMLRAITLALLLTALVEPAAARASLLRPLRDLMRRYAARSRT